MTIDRGYTGHEKKAGDFDLHQDEIFGYGSVGATDLRGYRLLFMLLAIGALAGVFVFEATAGNESEPVLAPSHVTDIAETPLVIPAGKSVPAKIPPPTLQRPSQ